MERAEYLETYPNHCKSCQGWGNFKRLSPDIRISDCEECITKERCPRCGERAGRNRYL